MAFFFGYSCVDTIKYLLSRVVRLGGRDAGILLWECYYLLAARHFLLLRLWGKDLKLRCDRLTQLHRMGIG